MKQIAIRRQKENNETKKIYIYIKNRLCFPNLLASEITAQVLIFFIHTHTTLIFNFVENAYAESVYNIDYSIQYCILYMKTNIAHI